MSKKCCKSYKDGEACKKCPRFRDWNYLMNWEPDKRAVQIEAGTEWLADSFSCYGIERREPVQALPELLPVLEAV